MLLEVFTQRNFCSRLFSTKLKFTEKIAKSRLVPPFGGLRGKVHGSSMARWKARGDFLLALIGLFSLALTIEAL